MICAPNDLAVRGGHTRYCPIRPLEFTPTSAVLGDGPHSVGSVCGGRDWESPREQDVERCQQRLVEHTDAGLE